MSADFPPNFERGQVFKHPITGEHLVLIDGVARGAETVWFWNVQDNEIYYAGEDPKESSDGMTIMTQFYRDALEIIPGYADIYHDFEYLGMYSELYPAVPNLPEFPELDFD